MAGGGGLKRIDLNIEEIQRKINYIKGVIDVHKYHVWSISTEEHALMTHVVFSSKHDKKLFYVEFEKLMEENKILYYTVQLEDAENFENI